MNKIDSAWGRVRNDLFDLIQNCSNAEDRLQITVLVSHRIWAVIRTSVDLVTRRYKFDVDKMW